LEAREGGREEEEEVRQLMDDLIDLKLKRWEERGKEVEERERLLEEERESLRREREEVFARRALATVQR
jgi:hypothetical protein